MALFFNHSSHNVLAVTPGQVDPRSRGCFSDEFQFALFVETYGEDGVVFLQIVNRPFAIVMRHDHVKEVRRHMHVSVC